MDYSFCIFMIADVLRSHLKSLITTLHKPSVISCDIRNDVAQDKVM